MNNTFIGFSNSTSFISRLIMWFTRSKASHCFIIFYDNTLDCYMIFESSIKGPALQTLEQFKKNNNIILIIPAKVDLLPGIKKEISFLEDNYDFIGIIGMMFVSIGRFFNKFWKNPLNTKNFWCSELVTEVLRNSDYPHITQIDSSVTTPQDLIKFLTNN